MEKMMGCCLVLLTPSGRMKADMMDSSKNNINA